MLASAHHAFAATLPSEAEAGLAKGTSRLLASRLKKGTPMKLLMLDDEAGQATVKLPPTAVGLLLRILKEMARGNAVTIILVHRSSPMAKRLIETIAKSLDICQDDAPNRKYADE